MFRSRCEGRRRGFLQVIKRVQVCHTVSHIPFLMFAEDRCKKTRVVEALEAATAEITRMKNLIEEYKDAARWSERARKA